MLQRHSSTKSTEPFSPHHSSWWPVVFATTAGFKSITQPKTQNYLPHQLAVILERMEQTGGTFPLVLWSSSEPVCSHFSPRCSLCSSRTDSKCSALSSYRLGLSRFQSRSHFLKRTRVVLTDMLSGCIRKASLLFGLASSHSQKTFSSSLSSRNSGQHGGNVVSGISLIRFDPRSYLSVTPLLC